MNGWIQLGIVAAIALPVWRLIVLLERPARSSCPCGRCEPLAEGRTWMQIKRYPCGKTPKPRRPPPAPNDAVGKFVVMTQNGHIECRKCGSRDLRQVYP